MKLLSEFKEFAIKGNVVDLAVGVIIGAAFGKIVSSFVGDVVMPPLGLLTGGVDFKELAVVLRPAQGANPAIILKYGAFLQTVFDFFLVAVAIFAMVQVIGKLKRKEAVAAPPAEPTKQEVLLEQIRDAVRAQKSS
ncbi:MAG TPA: large-conductance mechanosensitive channel protein MscL [Polyangiaceae bacterium]|jgi:large conductance mechanosensitive channel